MSNSSQTQAFPVAQTFGVEAPAAFVVQGFADTGNPYVPVQQDYVFRKDALRDVLAFLQAPCGDSLFITGPTGCGKSSLVRQIAARLNWPVQDVNCHGRTELSDLVGHHTLVQGQMRYVHGPVAVAVEQGHLLILNESDLVDPGELAGLNSIMDGAPLVIPENGGEVIKPHPSFRLICTGNSAGQGDGSGLYQGIMQQNLAFMDRFRVIEVDYPSEEEEISVLAKAVPGLPKEVAKPMIKFAGEVRKLFVGNDKGDGDLSVTFSTRTLIRFATLTVQFKGAPRPLEYALARALSNRTSGPEREAINRLAMATFGDLWDPIQSKPKDKGVDANPTQDSVAAA
jgi:cobaltochelatase CobS